MQICMRTFVPVVYLYISRNVCVYTVAVGNSGHVIAATIVSGLNSFMVTGTYSVSKNCNVRSQVWITA